MMNKLVKVTLLLFSVLIVSPCYGSKKKLFQQALSNGAPTGFYLIDNKKGESIHITTMRKYVSKQGYVAVDGESDRSGRMLRLFFIKPDDYDKYILYSLGSEKKVGLGFQKNKGKVFLFQREVKHSLWGWKEKRDSLAEPVEAEWTGKIADGYVHGKGSGIIKKKKGYTVFDGEFDHGLPVSATTVKSCSELYSYYNGTPSNVESADFEKPELKNYVEYKKTAGTQGKRAIDRYFASLQPELPEKYIKEAKEIIKSGKTPVLSEDIIGSLTFTIKTKYFSADAIAAKSRKTLEAKATIDPKAEEALNYMRLLDGLFLSAKTNANKVKTWVNSADHFDYMEGANYWKKLEEASEAARKLKNMTSARDIKAKLVKAEQTINTWSKNIEQQRVTYRNKRNKAARQKFGQLMDEAIRSSRSSSSSSSRSSNSSSNDTKSSSSSSRDKKSIASVDIENIKMPDYEWTSDWEISTLDKVIGTEDVAWSTRKIRFSDREAGKTWISRSADGKRYNISTGTGYTNLTDAIKAAFVYMKYGKKRETGRCY